MKTEKEEIKKNILVSKRERVKNLRQKFSQSDTASRRSGSGQITADYCDELVEIWGGSPVSEPLNYGSSTTWVNDDINADNTSDNPSSRRSNSLSKSTP